ncbi:PIG-L family deacetylase [Alcaligenaceae bacterium]|nr:PIG-L family deacetylase [Alcaligenaceae bacterium]
MKLIRLLSTCCCALLAAGGVGTAWAGPSLVQCNGIKDLVFVPHQDDDLLFMNPDIEASINAGACVQVVYLTASDRGEGEGYMLGREQGVRAAYAYMAQTPNIWAEDFANIGRRRLARFTLNGDNRIQLLHMRLQDPWLGKGWGSLTPLSQAESVPGATAESLGPAVERYSRPELVATIEQIIQEYQPTTVRHMDDSITIPYADLCWRCAGHDHPDHIASARLVSDAIGYEHGNYAEVAYVDYPSQERDTNLSASETSQKTEAFRRYAWSDYRYCTGSQFCQEPAGPAAAWVSRSYYVSKKNTAPTLLPGPKEGGISLFAVGEANGAANVWQSVGGRWASLGGRTCDPLVAFAFQAGQTGVFARDATGLVWANSYQGAVGWQGWKMIPGARLTALPAVSRQGQLLAVAMGNDSFFHYTRPSGVGNTWTAWRNLPPLPGALPQISITTDGAGAPTLFAVDSGGALWTTSYVNVRNSSQTATPIPDEASSLQLVHAAMLDKATWLPWHRLLGGASGGGLAASRNGDGLIELYFRHKSSGQLQRIVQLSQGHAYGAWSQPVDLGVRYAGMPAIALDENGAVVVAVTERSSGALWLIEAGQVSQLAEKVASAPALDVVDGVLYLAARSMQPHQTYLLKARSLGAWVPAAMVDAPPANGGSAFSPIPLHAWAYTPPLNAALFGAPPD